MPKGSQDRLELEIVYHLRELANRLKQLRQMEEIDGLSTMVNLPLLSLIDALAPDKPIHRTVQSALDTIHARYHTNLTLDAVAKEVFVSTTYLSSLFKQELGVNFLDYLHLYRIEQSKLLLQKNFKVYAVARKVGYQEERHFRITFKKWTGMTPTQFQKSPRS